MLKQLLILSASLLLFSCGNEGESINFREVKCTSGLLCGKTSEDELVKIFMGIPYAAPPLGDLRWREPRLVQPWEGIKLCTNAPPSAMQSVPKPFYCWSNEFLIPEEPISEDCLYLNIWTPATSTSENLPVMVWIHGGGFSSGSGTVPLYDGEAIARKGVVFVTINYRLGIFGFLAHPELSAESEKKVSGNYGLLDQIAALKWIRDNITAFGGNPSNVTIVGQSAGAFSVNMLIVSPLAKGLFSRAIAQSGGMFGKQLSLEKTLSTAEESGKALTVRLDCSIADLRKLPADSLLNLKGLYSITIDYANFPPVRETIAEGLHNDVPLISGWNADDGVSFAPPVNKNQFKTIIEQQYGNKAEEYLQVFKADTDEEAFESQKLISSLSFGWNNYIWAHLQTKTGKAKAFLYFFKHAPPGEPNFGAFHSAEFGYALHTLHKWDRPFTETDYRIEEIMSSYWVNFAKNGDPNGEGLPRWESFNGESPQIIEFGDEVKAAPLPCQKQLYFMNEVNNIDI